MMAVCVPTKSDELDEQLSHDKITVSTDSVSLGTNAVLPTDGRWVPIF